MSITIRKIAKDLKIAVSTVSKALSDSHEISEETKRLVLAYARKLNYIPNPYAGSLKNRKTRNIAVVLPEVADTFFSNAINGIDSVAQLKGYHVMVYLTHESHEREESILRELRGGRVDGVLVSVAGDVKEDSLIHSQLAKEMPVIFFDRVCEQVPTGKVLTDDFESAYKAATHLLSKGCREIVFLAAPGELSIINQRFEGFAKALRDHGISVTNKHKVTCANDEMQCRKIVSRLFNRKARVDGLVCSVEKLAMVAYGCCKEKSLNIPSDIKVIAFSNIQIADLLDPPLTTIEQPAFDMGKEAAILLFKALGKKVDLKKERLIIPSVLHERESTK